MAGEISQENKELGPRKSLSTHVLLYRLDNNITYKLDIVIRKC